MNDKREGKGTYTFACGDTYEGEWLDGMYHGYGKYSSKDSDEYEGQWVKDRMSGHGKFSYRELGDVYEGDFGPSGKYEGWGRLTCAEGVGTSGEEGGTYHGTWLEGRRHGMAQRARTL